MKKYYKISQNVPWVIETIECRARTGGIVVKCYENQIEMCKPKRIFFNSVRIKSQLPFVVAFKQTDDGVIATGEFKPPKLHYIMVFIILLFFFVGLIVNAINAGYMLNAILFAVLCGVALLALKKVYFIINKIICKKENDYVIKFFEEIIELSSGG